jgi:SagB-type dehydrogenase family enzyme
LSTSSGAASRREPVADPDEAVWGDAFEEVMGLRTGVYSVVAQGGRDVHLVVWPTAENLGQLSAGQRSVLRRLAGERLTREEICHTCCAEDGMPGDRRAERLVDRLRAGGWLTIGVRFEGRDVYTVRPLRRPPPRTARWDHTGRGVLSRFAVLRRDEASLVLESPRAWCEIALHGRSALAALNVLGENATMCGDRERPSELEQRLMDDLVWAGMVVEPGGPEEGELRCVQWSPHELWFHNRSRLGYRGFLGRDFGGTFWARGVFDPLPARPEPFPGHAVELAKPDIERLRGSDPTLTEVLEDRRSVREHDEDRPPTVDQLGEFLYRSARTRHVTTVDGVEYANRPYPSGGSAYELELYPLVRRVTGLEPGLYHYDSMDHRLRLVREASHPATRRLLRVAAFSSATGAQPQILIVIAARAGRLMWKYEDMAYSLILKHVGVLMQTMYCVATAMGLAPCGLGGGDSVAFTEATALDPLVECSVGEFMLGARPRVGQP